MLSVLLLKLYVDKSMSTTLPCLLLINIKTRIYRKAMPEIKSKGIRDILHFLPCTDFMVNCFYTLITISVEEWSQAIVSKIISCKGDSRILR